MKSGLCPNASTCLDTAKAGMTPMATNNSTTEKWQSSKSSWIDCNQNGGSSSRQHQHKSQRPRTALRISRMIGANHRIQGKKRGQATNTQQNSQRNVEKAETKHGMNKTVFKSRTPFPPATYKTGSIWPCAKQHIVKKDVKSETAKQENELDRLR